MLNFAPIEILAYPGTVIDNPRRPPNRGLAPFYLLLDDMSDFFDPTPEQQIVILVDVTTLRRAEKLIDSCEQCNPDAELPFDAMLDRVTASDPLVTDYILESPAKCPRCFREIIEKTLVDPE